MSEVAKIPKTAKHLRRNLDCLEGRHGKEREKVRWIYVLGFFKEKEKKNE